jgi:hypothetical protein
MAAATAGELPTIGAERNHLLPCSIVVDSSDFIEWIRIYTEQDEDRF